MNARDGYVAEVGAGVPTLSFRRAGMLREIRDGLDDATDAYVDRGLSLVESERAAVAEFGSPVQVAASIRAELAVATGRIMTLVVGFIAAAQMIIAEVAWSSGPAAQAADFPGWYWPLARVVDVSALAILVVGVGLAALLGSSPRMVRFARRFDRVVITRTAAHAVMVVVVVHIAAGVVLGLYGRGADALLSPSLLELVYSFGLPIIEVLLAVQCLRLTSPRKATGAEDGADDCAERRPFVAA